MLTAGFIASIALCPDCEPSFVQLAKQLGGRRVTSTKAQIILIR